MDTTIEIYGHGILVLVDLALPGARHIAERFDRAEQVLAGEDEPSPSRLRRRGQGHAFTGGQGHGPPLRARSAARGAPA